MAKVIRHGKTPYWGTYDKDNFGNAFILDSYNYSVEIKDYEQLDKAGKVCGYLIYDQQVNFDLSGTLLFGCGAAIEGELRDVYDGTAADSFKVGEKISKITLHNRFGGYDTGLNTPATAVMKSVSINTSQGSAATFSASGTIYGFSTDEYAGAVC